MSPQSVPGEWIPAGIPIHIVAVDVATIVHVVRMDAAVGPRRAKISISFWCKNIPPAGTPIHTAAAEAVFDDTIRVHITRTEAAADTDTGVRREFFLRTAYIIIIFLK